MLFICLLLFILPSQVFAQRKVPILIYHSIDEYKGHGSKELYVTPKNFEKQKSGFKEKEGANAPFLIIISIYQLNF